MISLEKDNHYANDCKYVRPELDCRHRSMRVSRCQWTRAGDASTHREQLTIMGGTLSCRYVVVVESRVSTFYPEMGLSCYNHILRLRALDIVMAYWKMCDISVTPFLFSKRTPAIVMTHRNTLKSIPRRDTLMNVWHVSHHSFRICSPPLWWSKCDGVITCPSAYPDPNLL